MALSSTTNRVTFAGNGSTTVFSFPYYFLAQEDLVVITENGTTKAETLKTIGVDYTVSGAANPAGGSVTFLAAPATGINITIYRAPSPVQSYTLNDNDKLSTDALIQALDLAMMEIQRSRDIEGRSLRMPDGMTATFDGRLPGEPIVANTVFMVNAAGNGMDWGPTADQIAAAQGYATAAAASASAASASATAAAASATAAASSATSASASAAAAAATLASAWCRGIRAKTFADTPIAPAQADNGYLFTVDASGGNVVINLPAISGLTLPVTISIQKTDSSANTVTVNRGGADTIEGATSWVLRTQNAGGFLVATTGLWQVQRYGNIPPSGGTAGVLHLSATDVVTSSKIVDSDVTAATLTAASMAASVTNRLNPAPAGAGKIPFDNGTTYSAAAAGSATQLLHGGTSPAFSAITGADISATYAWCRGIGLKSANYTIVDSDNGLRYGSDASGGAFTYTLSIISSLTLPYIIAIVKDDSSANAVTINTNGANFFEDGTTTMTLASKGDGVFLIPLSSSWYRLRFFAPLAVGTAGRIYFDNVTGRSQTADGGTTTKVLHGGATPAYAAVSDGDMTAATLTVASMASSVTNRLGPTPTAAGKIIVDTGTAMGETAAGTQGQILQSNAAALATWATISAEGHASNLIANQTTTAGASTMAVTADAVQLIDTSNNLFTARSVSLSINIATTGANALDTGSAANNTWYYFYVIAKADGTVAGLLSTSSSAPTMPSGYTFKRRLGAVRTDGSANIKSFWQADRLFRYMNSGVTNNIVVNAGTATTFTTISAAAFVPPISRLALLQGQVIGTATAEAIAIQPTGTTGFTYMAYTSDVNTTLGSALIPIVTDSSQQFDYKGFNTPTVTIWVEGFQVGY